MINFFKNLINLIISWFRKENDPDVPIKITKRVFVPLFVKKADGDVSGTWEYPSRTDADKKAMRDYLKNNAKSDEQRGIVISATPSNINGNTINNNMTATPELLAVLKARCRELVADGIAVWLCLYCDSPSGDMPRWWEIEKHRALWEKVHEQLKDHLTGVCLSMETNERATDKGQIEVCVNVMKECFPDLQYYSTHLQYEARGSGYTWDGHNTPSNINLVFMETNANLEADVSADYVMGKYSAVQNANPNLDVGVHEYNLKFSANRAATMERLRRSKAWGIG